MEQTKSSTVPVVLSIIITAVVVGGLVYWWQNATTNREPSTDISNEQGQQTSPPNDDHNRNTNQQVTQPQDIVYTNSTYGFTLIFPQTWKDYTTKSRTIDWGTLGTNDSIDFGFSVQDSLFNISVHSKSQWQKLESEEGPTPTYLGENSQYVFGYAQAQDAVNDAMVARMAEVQEIVKTFVLTK